MIGKSKLTNVDVLLIIAVIIWGLNPTMVKLGLREIPNNIFNAARFLVATITCWICLLVRERDWKVEKQDLINILLIGFIGNFIHQLLFITGISNTTAGNASLISAILPIIVAIICSVCRIEKMRASKIMGCMISFTGILLVVLGTGKDIGLKNKYLFGNIVIFIGIISWAVYTILNKKYLKKYSALKLSTYGVTIGTISMFSIWFRPMLSQDWTKVSVMGALAIIYSGVFSISLATIFWNMGILRVGSTRTSLYNNVTPIVSIICGAIFLGESLKLLQGVGAVLIFGGLIFSSSNIKIDLLSRRNKNNRRKMRAV